jgi:hypothetical protein
MQSNALRDSLFIMTEPRTSGEFSPNEAPTEPAATTTGRRLVTIEQKLDRALEALAKTPSSHKSSERMWRYVIVPLVIVVVHMLTRVWLASGGR